MVKDGEDSHGLQTTKLKNKISNRLIVTQLGRIRAYADDVMSSILVFQNNETAAMLFYRTNPVGVQLYSYVNTFFCCNQFAWPLDKWVRTLYRSFLSCLLPLYQNESMKGFEDVFETEADDFARVSFADEADIL